MKLKFLLVAFALVGSILVALPRAEAAPKQPTIPNPWGCTVNEQQVHLAAKVGVVKDHAKGKSTVENCNIAVDVITTDSNLLRDRWYGNQSLHWANKTGNNIRALRDTTTWYKCGGQGTYSYWTENYHYTQEGQAFAWTWAFRGDSWARFAC